MRRLVLAGAVLATVVIAVAAAYQVAARDRDYRALLARGDAALGDEQTFGAIEAYSGAIGLRPTSMLAHLRRGETYRRRGELDEAARDFRAAAALDPKAPRPLESLGDVLYQLQRYDRAADAYARALRLDDRSASMHYRLALAQYRGADIDGALGALDAAVRLNDRWADAQYLRGLCLRDRQRVAEAIEAFQRAVTLAPAMVSAREELADVYRLAGRHAEELDQLQALANLDRGHVERQVALGLAQARAGREELAIVTLGKALEQTPDQPLVYRALGQVWFDRAQAHHDRVYLSKALEALARAASASAVPSDTLTLYGRALIADGQLDLAERTLQQASTRYPLDPAALAAYAAAAERQGHLGAARNALIEYAALAADSPDLVPRATHIATLSVRLNDPRTAVAWLQRAADLTPDDVHVLASLADAQLRSGDRPGAGATLARALQKEPSSATLAALALRAR